MTTENRFVLRSSQSRLLLVRCRHVWTVCLLAVLLAIMQVAAGILRTGDVLSIHVGNHPELTRKVLVRADGTIDYPFLSGRSVLGMTPTEVGDLITFQLAKRIDNPFVLVTQSEAMPIAVRVLGQVQKPGLVVVEKGAALQEILVAAGGPTEYASLVDVKIIRDKGSDADAIHVNYKMFLETGDVSLLPQIRNNDTVILLSAQRNLKVKILGSVMRPGYYAIQGETNIFDAIYLAGGPAEKANLSKVRHILRSEGKNVDEVVDVQGYLDKGKMDDLPTVNEGEVIIVYKKVFTWGIFLNVVRDALMLFTAYKVFTSG